MATSFENFKGKIVLAAQFTAQDGQADKVASLFTAMRDHSVSDAEPGCLTFRVNRSGNEFLIFEEFINAAAITAHNEDAKHKAYLAELKQGNLLAGLPKIQFYEEL